jgi:hypothetical protein
LGALSIVGGRLGQGCSFDIGVVILTPFLEILMIQKLRDVIHVSLFVPLSCEILKLDVFVFAQDKRNKGAINEI